MTMSPSGDARFVRYLLGELSEDEQARLEQEYFNNPETLEQLAAVEDKLIDEYVEGTLQGERRRRFEQRLSTSPERRQRVEFARQLARYAASRAAPASAPGVRRFVPGPTSQLAAAAALVLALGGAGWMAIELRQTRQELARVENERRALADRERALTAIVEEQRRMVDERHRQQPPDNPTPPPGSREPRPPSPVVALSLLPGLTRSQGSANTVRLPPTATSLRLELQLPEDPHQNYRVLVETTRGRAVWKQERAPRRDRAGTASVTVDIPARVLETGDYVAVVSAQTRGTFRDVANYALTVGRK